MPITPSFVSFHHDLSFLHSTPKGSMMNNDLASLFGGAAFTPATVEPQTDFEVLPPGKYPCLIEAAEVKQTKAGTGHLLKVTLQVLDGPYKNRKIFHNINIQNPNTQCVEIGLRTLSALGRALGLGAITDTTQLLNGVVVAHVKVKDEQNNVRTYSAPTPATPTAAPLALEQTPQSLAYPPAYQPPVAPAPTVDPLVPVAPAPTPAPAPSNMSGDVAVTPAPHAPANSTPPWAR